MRKFASRLRHYISVVPGLGFAAATTALMCAPAAAQGAPGDADAAFAYLQRVLVGAQYRWSTDDGSGFADKPAIIDAVVRRGKCSFGFDRTIGPDTHYPDGSLVPAQRWDWSPDTSPRPPVSASYDGNQLIIARTTGVPIYIAVSNAETARRAAIAANEVLSSCGNDSGPPRTSIKTYILRYEDGEAAGHGYRSASINLNYRFLLCADEIQVAYGLDRSSLTHDDRYVVKMIAGRNFEYATPTNQPEVPLALPIKLRVTLARQDLITTVARLQDANAGVSLGMGCFTGQTQRVGMLKALLGPTPTRTQIQNYLDSLVLAKGLGPSLDYPLTNAEFPAPPPPAAKKPVARKKK